MVSASEHEVGASQAGERVLLWDFRCALAEPHIRTRPALGYTSRGFLRLAMAMAAAAGGAKWGRRRCCYNTMGFRYQSPLCAKLRLVPT